VDATENQGIPNRRRVFLLRHGEVSYFGEQGNPFRPDLVPLNAHGREQATRLAGELAAVAWDRVITSDLPRCTETAGLVLTGRDIPIETRVELREIRPGRLTDIPAGSLREQFLHAFGASLGRETQFLGGETFGSLLDRVTGFLRELVADRTWRQALVVAHGGVNRAVLCHALGSGLQGFSTVEQDACCLNILDVDDDGRWLIRLMNHTSHNACKDGLMLTTMERLFMDYRQRRGA
jgi:probable phosphoglycerate mutase